MLRVLWKMGVCLLRVYAILLYASVSSGLFKCPIQHKDHYMLSFYIVYRITTRKAWVFLVQLIISAQIFQFTVCYNAILVAVIKYPNKKQLSREHLSWLIVLGYIPSLWGGHMISYIEMNVCMLTWLLRYLVIWHHTAMRVHTLTRLLVLSSISPFIVQNSPPRDWCCPHWAGLPTSISFIKTILHRHAHRPTQCRV